jgi:ankyrin repeat protein
MAHNAFNLIGGGFEYSVECTPSFSTLSGQTKKRGVVAQIFEGVKTIFSFGLVASNPVALDQFTLLSDDCMTLICKERSIWEFGALAQVCKRMHLFVQSRFLLEAQMWGYSGKDLTEGCQYWAQFINELASCKLCMTAQGMLLDARSSKQAWVKCNFTILKNLDKDRALNILTYPAVYCLEKTKKIVFSAIEKVEQWDLSDNRDLWQKVLVNSTICEERQIVALAIKQNVDLDKPVSPSSIFIECDFVQKDNAKLGDLVQGLKRLEAAESQNSLFYTVTPLHCAVGLNQGLEVLTLLLENKANPNLFEQPTCSPLMRAIVNSNYEQAFLLLDHGALVNRREGQYQMTPFYTACERFYAHKASGIATTPADYQFIVQLQEKYGADPYVPNYRGRTAAQVLADAAAIK